MNHSWFINITSIFDHSAVSGASERIGGYCKINDLSLNILAILNHGEPALSAVYWREVLKLGKNTFKDSPIKLL